MFKIGQVPERPEMEIERKLNSVDLTKVKDPPLDFIGANKRRKDPICIRREGILK